MLRKATLALLLLGGALTAPAQSLVEIPAGHATLVEPTYMPYRVQFQMDTGDNNCPAGGWIQYIGPNTDNNKAVYGSLLAAHLSNRLVTLVYSPANVHNQSPCLVSYVQIK